MAPEDFTFMVRMLRRRAGLCLTLDKMALAERRLAPVMRRYGFRDSAKLIAELRLGDESLADAVTQAMTINETSFFRDPEQLLRLREHVLPRLIAARAQERRLRIWSAGCAAGQEAYTLAMILDAAGLERDGWAIALTATDLSADAIRRAGAGRYTEYEIARGLDAELRTRHFQPDGMEWVADESLRGGIEFRCFNLMDSFGWLGDRDIVFCRNVLMYFNQGMRATVLSRIADVLAPDGVLVLGESDVPASLAPDFTPLACGHGFYVKPRAMAALRAV